MPAQLKPGLRAALHAGGLATRILDEPMVYLGKNYLRVLGSVPAALAAAGRLPRRAVVIQICGESGPIQEEAAQAAQGGARIIFVDTGRVDDLRLVAAHLKALGLCARGCNWPLPAG